MAREGTRLKALYRSEVVPALVKKFGYANTMATPRLEKITVNVGVGDALQNMKMLDAAAEELMAIAGQKPVITRARRSIAALH